MGYEIELSPAEMGTMITALRQASRSYAGMREAHGDLDVRAYLADMVKDVNLMSQLLSDALHEEDQQEAMVNVHEVVAMFLPGGSEAVE